MSIDFDNLWRVLEAHFSLGEKSFHGPRHWRTVERHGLEIAQQTGADLIVVRLFAVFHDSERKNEGYDPQHGHRAASLARQLHGDLFNVLPSQLELLCKACEFHHQGMTSDEATIGTCWDADRLDLTRVGLIPDPQLMSTEEGRLRAFNKVR